MPKRTPNSTQRTTCLSWMSSQNSTTATTVSFSRCESDKTCIYGWQRLPMVLQSSSMFKTVSEIKKGTRAYIHDSYWIVHTMDELKMTGNCLKGSRPILSFDKSFESAPHWALLKELLAQVFNVPKGSRRSKPFFDHVLSFSIADNRIWFRNYQV